MEKEAKVLECEFAFMCPQKWEAMDSTENDNIHFCRECHREVYFAETQERLEEFKSQGVCVALLQKKNQPDLPPISIAGMVIQNDEEPPIKPKHKPNPNAQYCPRCNSEMPLGIKFCGKCGSILYGV